MGANFSAYRLHSHSICLLQGEESTIDPTASKNIFSTHVNNNQCHRGVRECQTSNDWLSPVTIQEKMER